MEIIALSPEESNQGGREEIGLQTELLNRETPSDI
jgi:hypothetical protein